MCSCASLCWFHLNIWFNGFMCVKCFIWESVSSWLLSDNIQHRRDNLFVKFRSNVRLKFAFGKIRKFGKHFRLRQITVLKPIYAVVRPLNSNIRQFYWIFRPKIFIPNNFIKNICVSFISFRSVCEWMDFSKGLFWMCVVNTTAAAVVAARQSLKDIKIGWRFVALLLFMA